MKLNKAVDKVKGLQSYLLDLIRGIVSHPDDVKLAPNLGEGTLTFWIVVHQDDVDKVVGKDGFVLDFIRRLMNANVAASKAGIKLYVEMIEESQLCPSSIHPPPRVKLPKPKTSRKESPSLVVVQVAPIPSVKESAPELETKDLFAGEVFQPAPPRPAEKYELFSWEKEILPNGDLMRFKDPIFEVIATTREVYGVDLEAFKAKTRGEEKVADARMAAMYICSKWGLGTSVELARRFNRDNHATIVHARKQVNLQVSHEGPERTMLIKCLRDLVARLPKVEEDKKAA